MFLQGQVQRGLLTAASLAAMLVLVATPAVAQHEEDRGHEHGDAEHTPAVAAQFVSDLETLESKFLDLAGAMSAEQYLWRPMEGVRSVSEVFMLMVAENYLIPMSWDAEPPEGMEIDRGMFRTLSEVTDKPEVQEYLERSFAYYKDVVAGLSAEKLHETIELFGRERQVHEALFAIAADMHEHLGQAIAYARMNQVVPPWTARAQENR